MVWRGPPKTLAQYWEGRRPDDGQVSDVREVIILWSHHESVRAKGKLKHLSGQKLHFLDCFAVMKNKNET